MTTQGETITHVFEKAGLGKAPFRCIGVETKVGPIKWTDAKTGIEMQSGAEGQPMGTCQFCYRGIADCFQIKSSDGKRFEVGCDCVKKTGDRGLELAMAQYEREIRKQKSEAKKAQNSNTLRAMLSDSQIESALLAISHPSESMAERGFTMLDWSIFMLEKAGDAGRRNAIKAIKKIME